MADHEEPEVKYPPATGKGVRMTLIANMTCHAKPWSGSLLLLWMQVDPEKFAGLHPEECVPSGQYLGLVKEV
jgi:hypothetical protein